MLRVLRHRSRQDERQDNYSLTINPSILPPPGKINHYFLMLFFAFSADALE